MSRTPISVLIVDDSATARLGIRAALRLEPRLNVVAEASSVGQAVALAERVRPDLITMDVYLEAGDGLDATERIMRRIPTPILVVTSADHRDPRLMYSAMAAGALDVAAKPPAPSDSSYQERCRKLCRLIVALSQVPVVRKRFGRGQSPLPPRSPTTPSSRPHVGESLREARAGRLSAPDPFTPALIAIGGSTGAPPVIRDVLANLSVPVPSPIAVVQHIMSGFGEGFARWLEAETGRRVVVVEEAVRPEPNVVYLPLDDHHLEVGPLGRLSSADSAAVNFHRPSVDVLFDTAVRVHGGRVFAVLLTGMGSDGARGLMLVTDAGGFTLAQSPESCAVASMPASAIALRSPTRVLDSSEIAKALRDALEAAVPQG